MQLLPVLPCTRKADRCPLLHRCRGIPPPFREGRTILPSIGARPQRPRRVLDDDDDRRPHGEKLMPTKRKSCPLRLPLDQGRLRPFIPLSTLRSSSSVLCTALLHFQTRLDLPRGFATCADRLHRGLFVAELPIPPWSTSYAHHLVVAAHSPEIPSPSPPAPATSELRHYPNAPPTSSAIPDERNGRVNRSPVVRYGSPASKEEPPHALLSLPALAGFNRGRRAFDRDIPIPNPCDL
jgi:hypothetical protein